MARRRRSKADVHKKVVGDIVACTRTISWKALVQSDLPETMGVEDLREALSALLESGTIACANRDGETFFVSVGTCGGPQRKTAEKTDNG